MGKLDDDFYDDEFDELDSDIVDADTDTILSKKDISDKKRLLRERIELRQIARDLEMDIDDWKEAFPDF